MTDERILKQIYSINERDTNVEQKPGKDGMSVKLD
jgi:hypothetical protein